MLKHLTVAALLASSAVAQMPPADATLLNKEQILQVADDIAVIRKAFAEYTHATDRVKKVQRHVAFQNVSSLVGEVVKARPKYLYLLDLHFTRQTDCDEGIAYAVDAGVMAYKPGSETEFAKALVATGLFRQRSAATAPATQSSSWVGRRLTLKLEVVRSERISAVACPVPDSAWQDMEALMRRYAEQPPTPAKNGVATEIAQMIARTKPLAAKSAEMTKSAERLEAAVAFDLSDALDRLKSVCREHAITDYRLEVRPAPHVGADDEQAIELTFSGAFEQCYQLILGVERSKPFLWFDSVHLESVNQPPVRCTFVLAGLLASPATKVAGGPTTAPSVAPPRLSQ